MLLDGVGVGGALTGTDDLIGKALGDGLDVPEGPGEHLCAAAGWSESPGGRGHTHSLPPPVPAHPKRVESFPGGHC